jgi:hypothetical protein
MHVVFLTHVQVLGPLGTTVRDHGHVHVAACVRETVQVRPTDGAEEFYVHGALMRG